jgi:hypothetical protein
MERRTANHRSIPAAALRKGAHGNGVQHDRINAKVIIHTGLTRYVQAIYLP